MLGDPGFSNSNATGLIQWHWTNGLNEQWQSVQAANLPTFSEYNIANAYSGEVLEDPESSTANGEVMEQNSLFDGVVNEQWSVVPLADGNDLIVNQASGLVLGDPGYSSSNGTPIIQWQLNGGLNEQWQFNYLGNGYYHIVNAYSDMAIGDPGFSKDPGTSIIQWSVNSGQNEEWQLFN